MLALNDASCKSVGPATVSHLQAGPPIHLLGRQFSKLLRQAWPSHERAGGAAPASPEPPPDVTSSPPDVTSSPPPSFSLTGTVFPEALPTTGGLLFILGSFSGGSLTCRFTLTARGGAPVTSTVEVRGTGTACPEAVLPPTNPDDR